MDNPTQQSPITNITPSIFWSLGQGNQLQDYLTQPEQYTVDATDNPPLLSDNLFNPPVDSTGNKSQFTGMAAGNLVGGAIGAYEFFKAQNELKKLQRQGVPNYTVSPELQNSYSRAEGMANTGFTASERNAYQRNIAEGDATSYYRATHAAGGNLSNVVQAGINSQNIGSAANLTIADAELRRENMQYADSLAAQIQEQKNKATAEQIAQYNLAQQAWGGAMTAGLQSFANSFSVGGLLKTAAAVAPLAAAI
jgi:hypothetical protein